eukprot:gene14597-17258_t
MVSGANNRLKKKYSSDFTYYFNNPELSDIMIQVVESDDTLLPELGFSCCPTSPTSSSSSECFEMDFQHQDDYSNSGRSLSSSSKTVLETFYAHKFVLSARSPVFMRMLSSQMIESQSSTITTHFTRDTMYAILKYLYSGNIDLSPLNVLDIIASADYYSLEELKEIKALCFEFITQHSMDILLSSPNWHLLTEESVILILKQDTLRVPEVEIFDSLVRWAKKQYMILKDITGSEIVEKDFLRRKLSRALECIRFGSMSPFQLSSHIEKSGLVDKDILYEAYRYVATREVPARESLCRVRTGVSDFTFSMPGDTNGIMYFLGTLEDTDEYDSPVLRKMVKVTSSPMSIGYPAPFVARTPTNMYTDKIDQSYFSVDIGQRFVVCPTYYSMRYAGDSQGSIYAAPRNWRLLGSLDGNEWSVLSDHVDDMSLKEGYSIASWPIHAVHSYRHLRIQMTGPNQREGNELCVCCFEVYGRLVKLEEEEDSMSRDSDDSSDSE